MNGDSGAGVVTALPPTTAPHKERYFDRVDESSPEYQRERNMAPDLRQDFNMMEQRKRVSMILQSPAFCDELDTMIHDQLKRGKTPTSLLALQQIADFMTTSIPTMYPAAPQGGMAALSMSLGMVTPVNDLRGSDSISYEKGEKLLRCKLAAFYRLTDLFGWSQLIYNHLTVRVNSDQERFIVVPFGLLYSEVSASSLVKINIQGEIVDRGSTNLGVNQAGFTLHSAIYAARPDVKCIVHVHTPAGVAVSAMKCGLLPISPEALNLGEVAYHDYHGILIDKEENVLIQKNLGPTSKVLILRNHGLVSVGETVEEAFYYIHNLVTACEIQVRTLASAGGPGNLVMLDPAKYKSRPRCSEHVEGSTHPKWLVGEQEFEAYMRMLDNLGYRTGYPYRCPALRDKAKKFGSGVEIAPSATGSSYAEDSDSGARSPLKHSVQRQQRDKTRWLNSGRPEEAYEEGPDGGSPKSKTKVWTNITHDHVKPLLRSLSSGVCVPSCITNCLWTNEEGMRQAAVANQFVPLNTNPKEVLEMRNKIREQNLKDIKTAGPESQVLCAGSMVDRSFVQGELVTASKAIIEKEYQPRVIINQKGPNPFNKQFDQELEEYRKEVELKQKGPDVQGEGSFTASTQLPSPGPGEGGLSPSTSPQKPALKPKPLCVPEKGLEVSETPSTATPTTTTSFPSRDTLTQSEDGQESPGMSTGSGPKGYGGDSRPESPHKDFHCAVLKALRTANTELAALTLLEAPDALPEPEEEVKGQSQTSTPPSTPVRAEEEPEHTYKDESDQATLRQTLPDLSQDNQPSDTPAPTLPAKDPTPAPPATTEGEEPADASAAGNQDCEQDGDEYPSKSPSKKKTFRTPSFFKKNKKKMEEKEQKAKET
ncbi:alpha-adducin-like isoform X1 [Salvelinus fontinalis]|uniref:alpha-adducin-like isoform X1 n=1 Tax=Salvelinus fontinalis TaxID=8038 RepID=UPI00248510ED|nr:alpha-adducin-like isoform X1 [Salvelinus fontinalis]XP_055731143.1 alpha-adducin-like isoform X1 [Salvelinus fontinalis]XP_055731144.1 alpha-adducin-like isoform X1 [Salvelinus fontinalis]